MAGHTFSRLFTLLLSAALQLSVWDLSVKPLQQYQTREITALIPSSTTKVELIVFGNRQDE